VETRSVDGEVVTPVATLAGDWCISGRDGATAVVWEVALGVPHHIALIDLTNGRRTPVATVDCTLGQMQAAPDGQTLVVSASCPDGELAPRTQLVDSELLVIDVGSGALRHVRDGIWTSPSFTPDGRSVIAADLSPSGQPDAGRIVRIDLESDERSVLVSGDGNLFPMVLPGSWAPSGR
jgi:Tol biopolymer transport system component